MKIKKVLPYVIIKCSNNDDFVTTQTILFKKGYSWVNGDNILSNNNLIKFPIYISNLPFIDDNDNIRSENIRLRFEMFTNSVLYFDIDETQFNKSLLREEKIKKIKNEILRRKRT